MKEPTSFIEIQYANAENKSEKVLTPETKKPQDFSFKQILRERKTIAFVVFIAFAVIVPTLIFFFLIDQGNHDEPDDSYTCLVAKSYRVACGKLNITHKECTAIHCCYDPSSGCYHSIPSRYYYSQCNVSVLGDCVFSPSRSYTPLSTTSLSELTLNIAEDNADVLRIILHTPDKSYRDTFVENKNYVVERGNNSLGVEVFRKGTLDRLLTTFRGPLIASDGYWEWSFQLTNETLFGFGEILIAENQTVSKVIYKNREDHNTLPNFMAQLNGAFHGVLVEHAGPLEVTVLPSRLVVLKSLTGSEIVLNLYVGPTPEDVMKQRRLHNKLPLPPYWALGAHICRDGKTTIDSAMDEYNSFTASEDKIQFASDCIHENLYTMLTEVNEGHDLERLIRELQAKSHFMMSVPPQILKNNTRLYSKAVELGLLYKNKNGTILNGSYLEHEVAFPDYSDYSISTWIREMSATLPVSRVDGFALRDNWPEEESYVFSDDDNKFPYLTEALNTSLSKTISWDAFTHMNSEHSHIFGHNAYGAHQAQAFRETLDFDFLLSSSYDTTSQEAALIQNIDISWSNLKTAIKTTLYHSIFGNPLISIPVCGSTNKFDETHEQLCMRWYLAAATFPLFRISSDMPRRDPSSLHTGYAQDTALRAIKRRYTLLPYYYTVLSEGDPLTRPMFYDFYFDNETLGLDEQYMVGKALLVAQPLLPDVNQVRVYLPPSISTWYEFWGGREYNGTGWMNLDIVENDWVMFIAEGHIIPMRNYKLPTVGTNSPNDTFMLAVALNCSSDSCVSEGTLKLERTSLIFAATEKGLTVKNIVEARGDLKCDYVNYKEWPHFIESIAIYGVHEKAVEAEFDIVDLCTVTVDEIYIEYFKIVKYM